MPKAGRRRTRGDPGTEREREAKEKKNRNLAEDRTVMFAAFESEEKTQSEAKLGTPQSVPNLHIIFLLITT